MRLKWIELNGFKSFPEKTRIEIHEGITCFVGPNGAGKSNIVDAFRWILGEHNPRVLRGEKMEEVIFQGSQSKKEKGLAEVSMLLLITKYSESNSSHLESLNTDKSNGNKAQTTETEIKRRLYRTGESYFIINGKQSRLKDIKELFLSEGVDIKTYSIIDQMKINEILSKPSQRKALLEECAGISIYKLKKSEAETKLQSAKENLQRIEDIIGEVKRQLNLLERQAKKAERYKKITEELKKLELGTSKSETIKLIEKIEEVKTELKSLETEHQKSKNTIAYNSEQIENHKREILETEEIIKKVESEIKNFENKKSALEKELAVLNQEKLSKNELKERLNEEAKALSTEIEKIQSYLAETEKLKESLTLQIERLQNEIITQEEAFSFFYNQQNKFESEIEKQRKNLFNLSTELANKKNNYQSLKKSIEIIQNKIYATENRIKETEQRISFLDIEASKKKEAIEFLKEKLQSENAEFINLQQELLKLEKQIDSYSQIVIEKKKNEAAINGKIEALQLEIWEEDKSHKLLFECIEVDPSVEEILESFLDEKLKAAVVEKIEEIENKKAKGIFFLKNLFKTTTHNQQNPEPSIRQLKNFIRIKEEGIDENTFDNVFIVKNLKEAITLQQSNPHAYFITLAGETLEPQGFVRIGKRSEILKKKRMLDELNKEKSKLIDEINSLNQEIEKLKNISNETKNNIETKRKSISDTTKQLIEKQEKYKSLLRELDSLKHRLKHLEAEKTTLQNEKQQNEKLMKKTSIEIETLSYSIEEVEKKIEEIKKQKDELIAQFNEKREELSNRKIELSTLKEKLQSKKIESIQLNDQIKRLLQRKDKNQSEAIRNKERTAQIEKEIEEKTAELSSLSQKLNELIKNREELYRSLNEQKNKLSELEKHYKKLNEEIQNKMNLIGQKKAEISEKTLKLENLWNGIYNRYGIDILREEIEPIEQNQSNTERIKLLTNQLREIGPVDIEILKEYEDTKERYDFLISQQKDITTSIEELQEAIKKINSLTRKKLRETFDALKDKFNSLFRELFEGGKAELTLTNENNILESEIEIQVQPPGKKSNNINLLSGGEKTLTAIAFAFACLSIKPSPLCILDEVDAPLDEPNTLRLRRLIKELSSETQFLIITHNKLIMEAADYIYGVTMQEEGVSTVISLQLSEVEAYA